MGLYLLGLPQLVMPLEKVGGRLWRRVQPLASPFLPVRRFSQALPLGLVWGWLPCGLVYTALTSALSSGAPWRGALIMLAFGAGTLPAMLLGGLFAGRVAAAMRHRMVRLAAGIAVAGFGVHALIGVARIAQA
jgi:sulfite exporter TauE/SafE